MSGGFFRGTSADQDTRFSNKNAKLLKTQKFPPELDEPIDFSKVKLDVIKPWIAKRVTEILGGVEDDVLINLIYALLEEKKDGKEIQIQITGFLEKNTSKFMKELWSLLLSAQKNMSGVPQQFIDEKAEETRKKKEFDDRITLEVQRLRQVHEQEQAATAEHNRKLTADVEAAKKAAAEAAARLSAQLLEQQDHKSSSGPPAPVSADRVAVVDEPGEKKQQDEPKQRSSRSPNPSDKSRSPERRTSRSPPRRARRSPLPPPRHAQQSRSPPPRRRMSRSLSPSRKASSRSRSRSRSRDSPYKSSPPRYRQSRRSPPYDMDRRGGGYYNGRSGSAYSGRRDKERDWHRRPGDRPYDNRAANERHYGRRMDQRDSYAERSVVRRGPERMDRRPPYDNRRPVYEDRHLERGHVGGKRSYREVEERRPVSPVGTRRSLSPPYVRGDRGGSGDMEQDSEEDVKPVLVRERQVGNRNDEDDRGVERREKLGVVVRRDMGGRRGAEAMREEDVKGLYPTSRIDTALKEVGGRKELAALPVVGSSEEEMEHPRSQRRDSRQEVSGLRRDPKVADEGDASPEDSEERREVKRRKKEEKRARKEERRKKREEKKQRKEEKRAAKEAKNRSEVTDGQGRSNGQEEEDDRNSEDEDLVPVERQKQLEEDLRKKALESLRAKKIVA